MVNDIIVISGSLMEPIDRNERRKVWGKKNEDNSFNFTCILTQVCTCNSLCFVGSLRTSGAAQHA